MVSHLWAQGNLASQVGLQNAVALAGAAAWDLKTVSMNPRVGVVQLRDDHSD
jgi:predicted small integral membrane protein